jgi:hypothetical protein
VAPSLKSSREAIAYLLHTQQKLSDLCTMLHGYRRLDSQEASLWHIGLSYEVRTDPFLREVIPHDYTLGTLKQEEEGLRRQVVSSNNSLLSHQGGGCDVDDHEC